MAAFFSIQLTSSYHESKSRRISNRRSPALLLSSSIPTPISPQEQTFDDFLPSTHPLHDLLIATSEACIPKPLEKIEGSSKPTEFRYEWGTWCSADKTDVVMELLSEIRLVTGAYEELMLDKLDNVVVTKEEGGGKIGDDEEEVDKSGVKEIGRRIRISSNKFYDIILYILPKGARYQHKWPEGSWTILQPLTGSVEIAQLRGPDRDGFYTKMRPRDLRGGGDGSGFLGGDAESQGGYSSSGEDCVKYLGGPLRSYTGKAMKSTLLEVVVRPPIDVNIDTAGNVEEFDDWSGIDNVLTRVVASKKEDEEDESLEMDQKEGTSDTNMTLLESSSKATNNSATSPSEGPLNKKMGMEFENVGGLDAQLDDIAVSKKSCQISFSLVENERYSDVSYLIVSFSSTASCISITSKSNRSPSIGCGTRAWDIIKWPTWMWKGTTQIVE